MLLMKKDMGGAANVLGLAHAIIDARLKVRLRVLIPIVENAIAGDAFRPGDVLPSRKGLTVEIGNTDAEGRLILADALALADEESPDCSLDMATLTGAARVALGPDLPPLYSTDDALARDLMAAGLAPTTRCGRCRSGRPTTPMLELQDRRREQCRHRRLCRLDHRGAVPAALRQERQGLGASRYLSAGRPKPGRPRRFGGTDQGIRAVYGVLKQRYPA